MKIKQKLKKIDRFQVKRTNEGVAEIFCKNRNDAAFAMGYMHATDRLTQMVLLKIAGQGRICELLDDNENNLTLDQFLRSLDFYEQSKKEAKTLPLEVYNYAKSYCDGVNYFIQNNSHPFEFKLVGLKLKKEEWQIEDTLLTIRLMSYLNLAQTQEDTERLIIDLIQKEHDLKKLQDIFAPHLDNLKSEDIELLKKATLFNKTIPDIVYKSKFLPILKASNNWVVSPQKSATGHPIACSDPHLEVNRLPSIWYEAILHLEGEKEDILGATIPGIPGVLMGRNKNLSFNFTYGFMDMVDLFIEKVESEQDYQRQKETIYRKKNPPCEIYIKRGINGPIDADLATEKLEYGYYFTKAWAGELSGTARSIEAISKLLTAKTVKEGQEIVRDIALSSNWLFSDIAGNIGYQQAGPNPERFSSGIYPLNGNDPEKCWKGLKNKNTLVSDYNSPDGFYVTANNQIKGSLKNASINLPMGPYRAERIKALLREEEKLTIKRMKEIQSDLYSLQAERYLEEIKKHPQKSKSYELLMSWDLCYDRNSIGAPIFDKFYELLFYEFFGKGLFGENPFNFLYHQTNIFSDYYYNFDRIIFDETGKYDSFFKHQSKRESFINALTNTETYFNGKFPTWGERHTITMTNMFLGEKLPKFLGLNYGPIPVQGTGATIVQGGIFQNHGRISSFCPSWRFISDLGSNNCYTVLAGGVSDRPFSKYYVSDVQRWLNFEYKKMSLKAN